MKINKCMKTMFATVLTMAVCIHGYGSGSGAERVTKGGLNITRSDSGSCGDGVSFSYDPTTKTLTINGTGNVNDFTSGGMPWAGYRSEIESIVIETGVKSVGSYAFESCTSLNNVTLSSDLISIKNNAFEACSRLANITIPSGVTFVGSSVFYGCSSLQYVTYLGLSDPETMGGVFSGSPPSICVSIDYASPTFCSVPVYTSGSASDPNACIECHNEGWVEKNCTATIFSDPNISWYINTRTIECYDIQCGRNGECQYSARLTCGKVCIDGECEEEYRKNVCVECHGCEEMIVDGFWEPVCVMDIFNECVDLQDQENACYEIVRKGDDFSVQKRSNITAFDGKTIGCFRYECENSSGLIHDDLCNLSNLYPNCYISECQEDGTCLNTSIYDGDPSICIECHEEGWRPTGKNCTAAILADPQTSPYINAKTIECYDILCTENSDCQCVAHSSCGKVCSDEECDLNNMTEKCMQYTGCEEILSGGIWTPTCLFEVIPGYKELLDQENACYEAVCEGGEYSHRKRLNITIWDGKTEGCLKYECNNESGIVLHSNCRDESKYICVSDSCIEKLVFIKDKWTIEIDIESVDSSKVNITQIQISIKEMSGIEIEEDAIGIEVEEKSNTIRIYINAADEETARYIIESIERNREEGCSDVILCHSGTTTRVITESLTLSAAPNENATITILMLCVMVLIIHLR